MKQLAQSIFAKAQARNLIDQGRELGFTYRPIYEDDVQLRIPSIAKTQRILGWNPTLKINEALDRCIDAVSQTIAGEPGFRA